MKQNKQQISLNLLLAVSSLSLAPAASAQSYLSPGYIMGEIRDGLGIIQSNPAPDFVVRGRPDPASLDYVPLKPPPRGFHSQAMTPSGRLQAEAGTIAELEAARAQNQSRAAASGAPASKPSPKTLAPSEEDPAPMKWNAWDTE
jgi:hypothetical protein